MKGLWDCNYQYKKAPAHIKDRSLQAMNAQQAKKAPKGRGVTAPEELKAVTLEITRVLQDNLHVFVNAENAEKALTGKERQRLFGAAPLCEAFP